MKILDLDKYSIDFECPKCRFYNKIFMRQVRLRDVIICRGCKSNIKLDDYMNEYRKAKRIIENQIKEISNYFR